MQADASSSESESETEKQSLKQQILQSLPPSISDGLDIDAWAWIGALHQPSHDDFWDVDLSLAVTKSFDQRLTVSVQGDLIGANGHWRGELRQGYVSTFLSQ